MNRRHFLIFATGALSGLPAFAASPAPQFEVPDTVMRKRRLSEFKGKTVVLEWTSASCPFVRAQYESGVMPELQKWAASQGIVWLSVISTHPSRRDYLPPDRADALHRARGGAPAALLMDSAGTMGRAYGAVVTPQMFVIDLKGEIVYSGAISDNSTTSAREARTARNYVRAALEDLAAGRKVATPSTRPFGCTVAYSGD
ncbi:MAG TPA: redoxin domain-containing protein [Burkholderiales bacterium]|nr:redoxin domain-containing protein [Burkholderiales bacterium]